jgi:hypothetical protein
VDNVLGLAAFLAVAAVLCLILRPHYTIALIWLFLSTFHVNKFKERAWLLLCPMMLLGFAVLFIFSGLWEALILHGFNAIDPEARASRFHYFGIIKDTGAGFEIYKSLVPLGGILGILGPIPSELYSRPIFVPFFLEGLLIFFSPVGVYFFASKQTFPQKKHFKEIFWLCLVPAILLLIVVHAPSGLLNPGSATRWRVNFEAIFHFAPLLLFYAFLDNERYANHPLPS